jgi:hypothetical protein
MSATLGFTVRNPRKTITLVQQTPNGMGFASPLPAPFIGPLEPPVITSCTTTFTAVATPCTVQNTRGFRGRPGLIKPLTLK